MRTTPSCGQCGDWACAGWRWAWRQSPPGPLRQRPARRWKSSSARPCGGTGRRERSRARRLGRGHRAISEEIRQQGNPAKRTDDVSKVLNSQALVRPAIAMRWMSLSAARKRCSPSLAAEGKAPDLEQLAEATCGHQATRSRRHGKDDADQGGAREALAMEALAVRRQVVFSNPRLDFANILCIARGVNYGTTKDGDHMVSAYYGFNGLKGGGLYVIRNFKSARPRDRQLAAKCAGRERPIPGQNSASRRLHLARIVLRRQVGALRLHGER